MSERLGATSKGRGELQRHYWVNHFQKEYISTSTGVASGDCTSCSVLHLFFFEALALPRTKRKRRRVECSRNFACDTGKRCLQAHKEGSIWFTWDWKVVEYEAKIQGLKSSEKGCNAIRQQ